MAGLGDLVDDVNMERSSRVARSQSGQALVETAITMPLFVFLMLGLLQLSLMNQARYMAKYAAYKAARAGSIHNASRQKMENAALGVLMPFVGNAVYDTFYKTDTKVSYSTSFGLAYASNKRNNYTSHGISPVVEVTICGPSSADVGNCSSPPTSRWRSRISRPLSRVFMMQTSCRSRLRRVARGRLRRVARARVGGRVKFRRLHRPRGRPWKRRRSWWRSRRRIRSFTARCLHWSRPRRFAR